MLMAHAGTAEKTDHANIRITFSNSLSTIYHTPDCYLRSPRPLYFTRRRLNALPPYVPDCTPQKTPSPRGWKPAWESLPRGDSVLDI